MNSYFTAAERRRGIVAAVAAIVLTGGAVALAMMPRSVEVLSGIRPGPSLAAPDDLPPLSGDDATPFFLERDEIEIRVGQAMTLRQFLDRNRLNKPYHRKQIVEQLGNANPDAPIAAGTLFRLRLTPVAEDVPGTAPKPRK